MRAIGGLPIDWDIQSGIDRLMEDVWYSAEKQGLTWQEVDRAFQHYGIEGFDEWWKEGEQ